MDKIGKLYNGKMYIKRREWRGVKDTAYDFYRWLVTWKDLTKFVMRSPVRITKAVFNYRWMASYLTTPAFIDRHTMGQRGTALRISHLHFNMMIKHTTVLIANMFKADKRFGDTDLSEKIILFDEMMPMHLMSGFPNLLGIPSQLAPIFQCSVIDQQSMIPYLDAIENYGLPADVCPLPASEAGASIVDEYPIIGKCYITSSMPCDGSVMASSYQDRYFKLPTFNLSLPVRYLEKEVERYAVEDLKDCIAFIEEQTGETFDWDAYFKAMTQYNEETEYELEKWEINKTPYPQITGASLALYRMYSYLVAGSMDKRFLQLDEKVNKLMMKAYEKKEKCSRNMKHRAIVWSPPAHYYSNFSTWAENCWGINVLIDMESMVSTKLFNLENKEESLKDLAHTYERMTMRRHTNGGYVNVLDELWRVCEEFDADIVLMFGHISCKTMAGLTGLFEDQARERGIHLIWIDHDLMDPRTVSRKAMREKVNMYMKTVFQEEPVDESLVDFDDELTW